MHLDNNRTYLIRTTRSYLLGFLETQLKACKGRWYLNYGRRPLLASGYEDKKHVILSTYDTGHAKELSRRNRKH